MFNRIPSFGRSLLGRIDQECSAHPNPPSLILILTGILLLLLGTPLRAQGWVEAPNATSVNVPPMAHAVYDEARQNIAFGGLQSACGTYDGTTITLVQGSLGNPPTGGNTIALGNIAYDPRIQRVVGMTTSHSGPIGSNNVCHLAEWDGIAWTYRPTPVLNFQSPLPVTYSLCWDPTRQSMLATPQQQGIGLFAYYVDTLPAQPSAQVAGSASFLGFINSIFVDTPAQRPTITTIDFSPGAPRLRTYRWNGNQWIQQFPIWPFVQYTNPPGYFSNPAGSTLASGALAFFYTQDPSSNAVAPRTTRLANGIASEIFLTSYPPEGNYTTVWHPLHSCFYAFSPTTLNPWRLTLGPDAQVSTQGSGCAGSRGTPTLAPQQGSTPKIGTTFVLQSLNLPLSGPVFLALGASDTLYGPTTLPLNLAPLGAPQCNLLVSIDNLFPSTNILGAATWGFPIPNIPGGVFFTQAVVFDQPANAFGITLSNAVRGVVGS